MRHIAFLHGFHGHFLAFHGGGHDGGGFVLILAAIALGVVVLAFSRK